jgi:mannose-6-phosphate isomerase-like protein (cupin superfamily)
MRQPPDGLGLLHRQGANSQRHRPPPPQVPHNVQRFYRMHHLEDRSTQGFASGPHLHREADEAWYLLEGELQVYVGNQMLRATAGSLILIPRGTPHNLTVVSEVARKLICFSPSGDEKIFRFATEPLPDGYTRQDWIRHMMESVGMERVPAPPWE